MMDYKQTTLEGLSILGLRGTLYESLPNDFSEILQSENYKHWVRLNWNTCFCAANLNDLRIT